MLTLAYHERISRLHRELGIPADYARRVGLPLQEEAVVLTEAGLDLFERPQRLTPDALAAWQQMQATAAADGVDLRLVSAFRSVDYQGELLRRKLAQGRTLAEVLTVNAAPGYSEHHTGRAIDLATPDCAPLEEAFENTAAFAWLQARAGAFGFRLSYPRSNPHALVYEPWHWLFQPLLPGLTAPYTC